jgi:hypothetical protein
MVFTPYHRLADHGERQRFFRAYRRRRILAKLVWCDFFACLYGIILPILGSEKWRHGASPKKDF